jgi:predicted metal-binding membrane protein
MLLVHNATADPGALCLGAHIHAGAVSVAWRSGVLGGMLVTCLLMVVAMVPVLAVPLVRHVSARTFPGRRDGAVAFFLGGSVCVWLLVGVTVVLVLSCLPLPHWAAVVTFAVAAIWQFTPAKRRALLRCHRTVPLAPMGWQSDRDCFLFGASHGAGCVASCWAMMLAVMVAGHDPIMTLCVQGVALAERRSRLPWVRGSALLLLACGTVVLFHTGL